MTTRGDLNDPHNIPFPGIPYPQQESLMTQIFTTIRDSKVGILESPTGTGKTISLISSCLFWLVNEETASIEEYSSSENQEVDDWAKLFVPQPNHEAQPDRHSNIKVLKKAIDRREDILNRIRIAKTCVKHKTGMHSGQTPFQSSKNKITYESFEFKEGATTENGEYADLMPYFLEEDAEESKANDTQLGDESDDEELEGFPKLIYCSRTHTQISQFVNEIKKTIYKDIRCITLGSRKNLCVNPDVNVDSRNQSDAVLSEKCLELINNNKTKDKSYSTSADSKKRLKVIPKEAKTGCPFHKKIAEESFIDHALGGLYDIEDLSKLGRTQNACPYYGARRAVKYAQIICCPYNALLQADMRKSLKIPIKGNIIVFDEAHNLVDAITQAYSATIRTSNLCLALIAVMQYFERFKNMLNGRNFHYVGQLLGMLKSLHRVLPGWLEPVVVESELDVSQNIDIVRGTVELSDTREKGCDALIGNQTDKANSGSRSGNSQSGSGKIQSNTTSSSEGKHEEELQSDLMTVNDFLFKAKIEHINLFQLKRHMVDSNLVRKIGGYGDNVLRNFQENSCEGCCGNNLSDDSHILIPDTDGGNEGGGDGGSQMKYTNALRGILGFISCLTTKDSDGRIVISKTKNTAANPKQAPTPTSVTRTTSSALDHFCHTSIRHDEVTVKFMLLNPHTHMQPLVDAARSVILLGGTLQPFNLLESLLFPSVPPERINRFSCGHVIPRENVRGFIVRNGPSVQDLSIKFDTRSKSAVMNEICNILCRLCAVIPNGVVAFFSSYSYLEELLSFWNRGHGVNSSLHQLKLLKNVFIEPKESSDLDTLWNAYVTATESSKGAILFCVMGGKLSEGINFSDNLARGVVVFGLPYPDVRDRILREKLKFIEQMQLKSNINMFEAICMKAVNQSIGRAIRHINDYACIILVDQRYASDRIRNQLPQWIAQDTRVCNHFVEIEDSLGNFFKK